MCKAMEDMRNEAALAARLEERQQFAKDLLEMGELSYEQIAKLSRLTVEEVRILNGNRGA